MKLRGNFNGWGVDDMYQLTQTSDNNMIYEGSFYIPAGQLEFKVADAEWKKYNFGGYDNTFSLYSDNVYAVTIINNGWNFICNNWNGGTLKLIINLETNTLTMESPNQPTLLFSFNESEWMPYGTAQFKDGWIAPGLDLDFDSVEPNTLTVMKSRVTEGDYLLVNPYINATFKDLLKEFGDISEGYILFNIADPNCVYVYPGVGSGAYIELGNQSYPQQLYNYNLEGYLKIMGLSNDEIRERLTDLDYKVSYMNAGIITIYNCVFSMEPQLLDFYGWKNTDDITQIIFNPDSGVDSLEFEEDINVRWYNLQGIEIPQPSKGQVVIKKANNKVTKMMIP